MTTTPLLPAGWMEGTILKTGAPYFYCNPEGPYVVPEDPAERVKVDRSKLVALQTKESKVAEDNQMMAAAAAAEKAQAEAQAQAVTQDSGKAQASV
jgi:hypothetical protein